MAKIKEFELTLADKSKVIIPIWSKNALKGKKCHIDRLYSSNDIVRIKINFFDDDNRSYDVIESHVRRKNIKKYRERKRVIK